MKKNIALVVVALPVEGPFDYAVTQQHADLIQAGMRVSVSFSRRKMSGVVVGFKEESQFAKLNAVIGLLENRPSFSAEQLQWAKLVAQHYACSWGEALELFLPVCLRKTRLIEYPPVTDGAPPAAEPTNVLIIDHSGKQFWPDVLEAVKSSAKNQRSTIILAPEKTYAGQIARRIGKDISLPVLMLEKKLKVKEALAQHMAICGTRPCVMVGTRSAVFAPNPRVGQIIILDADNEAYKEEQSPHYRCDRVAEIRAVTEGSSLLLVSSNPDVEHWHTAKNEKWTVKEYQDTAPAKFQLVDMNNYNPQKSSILSFPLQNSLQKVLEEKGKVLLYFNRKGFSTFTQCNQCGHTLKCERCNTHLTYLYSKKTLVCRSCNFTGELPSICPQCKGSYLRSLGMGIEKLESEVHRYYPFARIAMVDKDSKSIPAGADIVLATSAILNRGSGISVDLAAVLQYDNEINRSDFRCSHKALSVLIKLRQMAKDKLIVQTRNPDDQAVQAAVKSDFRKFLDDELETRKELGLPPFKHLVELTVRGEEEVRVLETANQLCVRFKELAPETVEVIDPYADVRPKLRDQYRYIIMLKSKSAPGLVKLVRETLSSFKHKRNIIVTVNVDP
jgi:primosomal protein N' (replication factor Y)